MKIPKHYQKVITAFPSNVPFELINQYKQIVRTYEDVGGYQRKLARRLDVNMKYLNDLLVHGKEPTNRTKKGREARKKLFLKEEVTLEDKEQVVEVLEGLVAQLQEAIRRLK